jgi:hypothetical protein
VALAQLQGKKLTTHLSKGFNLMSQFQKRFLISTCTLGLAAMTLSFHAQSQIVPLPSPSVSASASPSASPSAAATPSVVGDQRQVFTAQLNPLNVAYNASGFAATGIVTIVVDGTNFGVYSTLQGLDPNVVHTAYIHANNECPTPNSDTNGDGIVDATEASIVSGAPIIPLDFSLNTFTTDLARPLVTGGSTLFPTADSTGALTYIGSGTLSTVQAEALRTAASSQWDPAQWSVIVSGVDTSVTLPSTVQTTTGFTSNESLPVACGVVVQQSGPTPSPSPSPSASVSASPSPTASATPSPSATATAGIASQQ